MQPLGLSNGLVTKGGEWHYGIGLTQTLYAIRFVTPFENIARNNMEMVRGDFGQSMTIKGIAMRSSTKLDGVTLEYASRQEDPWIYLGKSSRNRPREERVCKTS